MELPVHAPAAVPSSATWLSLNETLGFATRPHGRSAFFGGFKRSSAANA